MERWQYSIHSAVPFSPSQAPNAICQSFPNSALPEAEKKPKGRCTAVPSLPYIPVGSKTAFAWEPWEQGSSPCCRFRFPMLRERLRQAMRATAI